MIPQYTNFFKKLPKSTSRKLKARINERMIERKYGLVNKRNKQSNEAIDDIIDAINVQV